jgi:hypothetical protein
LQRGGRFTPITFLSLSEKNAVALSEHVPHNLHASRNPAFHSPTQRVPASASRTPSI